MDELLARISSLQGVGWAGAIATALGLVLWLICRKTSLSDEEKAEKAKRREAYEQAKRDWTEAVRNGNTVLAIALKERLDSMRRKGWHLVLAAVLILAAGCRTTVVHTIPVGEHILQLQPGDVLPALPAGETRWWALTPSGLEMLLPQDAPVLQEAK